MPINCHKENEKKIFIQKQFTSNVKCVNIQLG